MYKAYFGLTEAPFSIAPDPRFLYLSDRYREALAHLLYGVRSQGGFVQLTGEVGTGKTTLCRCFLNQLPKDVDVALILNPKVSEFGLVASICDELGIAYREGLRKSLKELVDLLNAYLLKKHAEGRRTVVIIDEAQNLPVQVLEQVRLLTNLETNKEKLLRIVLIGQPELRQLLERSDLRQLAQRITARFHLEPLSVAETSMYMRYRLAVAGRREPLFTRRAIRQVHRVSGGIPRLINVICDRALLGAYAGERPMVDAAIVKRAAREVFGTRPRRPLLRWLGLAATATVAAVLVAGWFLAREAGWDGTLAMVHDTGLAEMPATSAGPPPVDSAPRVQPRDNPGDDPGDDRGADAAEAGAGAH
jgi:general secretion pathway protein A